MKRLLSLVLVMAMLFNCMAVFAEPLGELLSSVSSAVITISDSSTEKKIIISSDRAVSDLCLYVAAYKGGVLHSIVTQDDISLVKGDNGFDITPTWTSSDRDYVKVFLWDENMRPATEQKTIYPPLIKVETVNAGVQDGTVEVDISIENNPGISSLKFDVVYEENLILTQVRPNNSYGMFVDFDEYSNPYTVSFMNYMGDVKLDDVFVTLVFDVSEIPSYVSFADIALICDADNTFNERNEAVSFDIISGGISFDNGDAAVLMAEESPEPMVLALSEKSVKKGEMVEVQVDIANNPGIASMIVGIEYDEKLVFENIKLNSFLFSNSLYSNPQDGVIYIGLNNFMNNVEADGTIAVLTFKASEEAENGHEALMNVNFDEGNIFDVAGNYVKLNVADCKDKKGNMVIEDGTRVTIYDLLPGDVVMDNKLTNYDAMAVFRHHMKLPIYGEVDIMALDADGNGLMNTLDGQIIFNHVTKKDNVLYRSLCLHTSLVSVEGKASTCTEVGYEAYWKCDDCGKMFSDEKGSNEIKEPVEIERIEHSYSQDWSMDDKFHWHASTCGCDVVADKSEHQYGSGKICSSCGFDGKVKLSMPTVVKITSEKIEWATIENALGYKIVVDGKYSEIYPGTATNAKFTDLYWVKTDGTQQYITDVTKLTNNLTIQAIGDGEEFVNSDVYTYSGVSYYVPLVEDSVKYDEMLKWGIGQGYDLINEVYLDLGQAKTDPILNKKKMLKLYDYYHDGLPNYSGYGHYETYSTMDEFIIKAKGSLNRNADVSALSIIGINGKSEINLEASYNRKKYNQIVKFEGVSNAKQFVLTAKSNYRLNPTWLTYCLSDTFNEMISGRENDYNAETYYGDLAKDIFDTYGTHVILGVETGGTYNAEYVISTDKQEIAAAVKNKLEMSGGGTICDIVKLNLGFDINLDVDGKYTSEDIEASFECDFKGGNQGFVTDPNKLQDAIDNWASSVEEHEVANAFSANGAISIGELIRATGDTMLANAFDAYVKSLADDKYFEVAKLYTYKEPRLLTAPETDKNGKNVMTIDLSAYQRSGSLDSAYDPNLLEGKLKLYPFMFNKYIDKIVVVGDTGKAGMQLIDDFSIVLDKNWSRPLEIEIRNFGAVASSDYGIVDTSMLPVTIKPTIKYAGVNLIACEDGKYDYFAENGTGIKKFTFYLEDGQTVDSTTVRIENDGTLYLPVIKQEKYTFVGWIDGNGVEVADYLGKYNESYTSSSDITTLYPVMNLSTFKITLNNEFATDTTGCSSEFYWIYNDGPYRDVAGKHPLNDTEKLILPTRTGHTCIGYWLKNENGEFTSRIVRNDGVVDPEHNIEGNIIAYARWEPIVFEITIDDPKDKADGIIYQKYGVGFYSDKECDVVFKSITVPTYTGYGFGGFKDENDVTVINADGTLAVANNYFKGDATVTAQWNEGTYTVTLDVNAASAVLNTAGTTSVSVVYTKSVSPSTITTPKRNGYTFEGYYKFVVSNATTSAEGITQYIDRNGKCLDSIKNLTGGKIYALWKPITYTVTYNLNIATSDEYPKCYTSASMPSSYSTRVVYGADNTLPTPTATYYTFAGWYTDPTNGKRITGSSWGIANDTTLYAHWTKTKAGYTYVKTATDFKNISSNNNGKFALVSNIDISSVGMLGNFYGELDGNGYTISNWAYRQEQVGNVGLFSTNHGTIANLKISNFKITTVQSANITGDLYSGLLCAKNRDTLSNITVDSSTIHVDVGNIEEEGNNVAYVGMLCGENTGTIKSCTVNGTSSTGDIEIRVDVSSSELDDTSKGQTEATVGGIVGYSNKTISSCTVKNCRIEATCSTSAYYWLGCKHHGRPRALVGGVVGYTSGGSISSCTSNSNTLYARCNRPCHCKTNMICASGGVVGHSTGGSTTLSNNSVSNNSVKAEYYDNGNLKTESGFSATGTHVGTTE